MSKVWKTIPLSKMRIYRTIGEGKDLGNIEEPIAFGLSALIAHIVLPEDRSGVLDEVESYLLKIKEVSQIETIMVRRA